MNEKHNISDEPKSITLQQWDERYECLYKAGMPGPDYNGPLGRHFEDGDLRLASLRFDNSPAALRLWNLLLSEEDRLQADREAGRTIIGAMKDLGTVPVMAYALDNVATFYPDGAWWIPCVMQHSAGLLRVADKLGIDESFCPVRAMVGAFETGNHFPTPDLLICSVGAVCDDFSAIAQRVEAMGHPVLWWEVPPRRLAGANETSVRLPSGFTAASSQVDLVRNELRRVAGEIEKATGQTLTGAKLSEGIRKANTVREKISSLRQLVYTSDPCPLPALEMLIVEMLALHYCSDYEQTVEVLDELLTEARRRVDQNVSVLDGDAVRVFWVNPVADLQVMNLLEEVGGRISGTDYMFCHALSQIPDDVEPFEALARTALGDPMVGPTADRARMICREIQKFGCEAVIVSRIPGASHCAFEGEVIGKMVRDGLGLPVVEVEVPTVIDAVRPALRTRLEALMETARGRRQ